MDVPDPPAGGVVPGSGSTLTDRLRELALTATAVELAQVPIGAQPFETSLRRILELALAAVPAADGASVTVVEARHGDTLVVSDESVARVHAAMAEQADSPVRSALSATATCTSGDLGADGRWPRSGPRAAALGFHSVVATPLTFDGRILGVLVVYARVGEAFDAHAVSVVETLAVAAAVPVFNARRVEQAERLAEQLQTALTSRAVIDQAIGILMSRQGGTSDDAFERLRLLSQTQNTKLQAVAQSLVDDAVSRARARHAGGS